MEEKMKAWKECVDAELKQKDAELEQRDIELKQKDTELEQKDTELEQKDAELEQKDAELKQKDAELKQKDAELKQTLEKYAKDINALSDKDKRGEKGKIILESMYNYVRENPKLVCSTVAAGVCTGLFVIYGVPFICTAVAGKLAVITVESALVSSALKATAAAAAAGTHCTVKAGVAYGCAAGAGTLLVGDYCANGKTNKKLAMK